MVLICRLYKLRFSPRDLLFDTEQAQSAKDSHMKNLALVVAVLSVTSLFITLHVSEEKVQWSYVWLPYR